MPHRGKSAYLRKYIMPDVAFALKLLSKVELEDAVEGDLKKQDKMFHQLCKRSVELRFGTVELQIEEYMSA